MLAGWVRLALALTAIAPISIPLAYAFGTRGRNYALALIALVSCALLTYVALKVVKSAQRRLERLPVRITKAKCADKEVIGFFVAYVLPLVFRADSAPDIGAWGLIVAMLFFVLWSTHATQVNPVLGILGYHFFEVETEGGITYLLITKSRINNAMGVKNVVQIGEYGILESLDIGGGE